MDILIKRKDIAAFFEEKATLQAVQKEFQHRLEIGEKLGGIIRLVDKSAES